MDSKTVSHERPEQQACDFLRNNGDQKNFIIFKGEKIIYLFIRGRQGGACSKRERTAFLVPILY